MKLKNLLLGLVIVFALGACGDDEEKDKGPVVDCNTFGTEIPNLAQDITDALNAYSADASAANCKAVYNSYYAYIDGVEKYIEKCVPQLADSYSGILDSYKNQISSYESCD